MNATQLANFAIKFLASEGEERFLNFHPSDVEQLVKHSLTKMGYPVSLMEDSDLDHLYEIVRESIKELQQDYLEKAGVSKESWYVEATVMPSKGKTSHER